MGGCGRLVAECCVFFGKEGGGGLSLFVHEGGEGWWWGVVLGLFLDADTKVLNAGEGGGEL